MTRDKHKIFSITRTKAYMLHEISQNIFRDDRRNPYNMASGLTYHRLIVNYAVVFSCEILNY